MRQFLAGIVLAAPLLLAAAPAAQAQEARAAVTGPKTMAHLASYRGLEAAERGWRVMTELYSSVLYFQPELRIVDLDGKGQWFRLYAEGDQALMRLLCDSLTARKLYCVLHDRETLKPLPAR